MASVYRGHRRRDGQPVAIKIPHPSVAGDEILRERFRTEYRAGRELNHPNIVRMLDFGQESGTFYLVMELVDGPDLWQRLREEGPLPEAEAVGIIVQIAQALHEAHKHGYIHRDVKPDNILLTATGQAKLADLGLIKELESEANLTRPQKGLGTPNFMSPEQFTEAKNADARCDIYSLGTTLYMAVTGRLPFEAKTLSATLRKKLNNELTPPRKIVPGLSETVDWAIRRAVQIDPQCRPADCLEFIQSLRGENTATGGKVARPAARQSTDTKEKRRATRYPCTFATVCELSTSIHPEEPSLLEPWQGQILNLSTVGIGLLLGRRFQPGTLVAIVLENPPRTFQVRANVRVVRSLKVEPTQWFLGVAFLESLSKQTLRKLLWSPSCEQPEKTS